MSDRPGAMEGVVLPEWGIHIRNLVDRIAPVVNEHHQDLHELKQTVQRLERIIAQQAATIQKQDQDIAIMRAVSLGTGPTTTEPGG